MKVFLVREKGVLADKDGNFPGAWGLYISSSVADLFNLIDETTDPFGMEYLCLNTAEKQAGLGLLVRGVTRISITEALAGYPIEPNLLNPDYVPDEDEPEFIDNTLPWRSFTDRDYKRAYSI